ncbi:hypothetical protein [Gynuella sunshinyii]|uniref:hypothetical protein n=1 Tax=Gynuella sunshinyii TaxID=1445505 RepID=UPI0005CBFAD9|nr:hypothetical protein [Gynuella sunshinyii]
MKSYFLENIDDVKSLEREISTLLPGQKNPWLIWHPEDVCAYVYIILGQDPELVVPAVAVNISGRHYKEDELILNFLQNLKNKVGGKISDDA